MLRKAKLFAMRGALTSASLFALGGLVPAYAQTESEVTAAEESSGLDDIVVMGRKRSTAETLQSVPIAVTAFGAAQLEAAHVRDLEDLTFSAPNVSLDSVGTTAGFANFSIRGLAINGSVPSIEPTVGVFVDGMYLGVPAGVVQDTFDLEGVEILRGPQGLLFGRNVTGGAVLIRTAAPSDEYEVRAKFAVETGLDVTSALSINTPLIENVLNAKFSIYHNNDEGYFRNIDFGNRRFGGQELLVVRPYFQFTPTRDLEFVLRLEHGDLDASGPAVQNRNDFPRGTFQVSNDEEGFTHAQWTQAILDTNYDVAFGNGTLRNVLAYRSYDQDSGSDIDATQFAQFHGYFYIDQEQFSNELVYSGRFFDRWNLTAGVYYFNQDLFYIENRQIPSVPALANYSGGGLISTEQFAVFTQSDVDLVNNFTLTFGTRFTHETKDASISTLSPALPGCSMPTHSCVYDFEDSNTWEGWSPSVGLNWSPSDDLLIYTSWSRGYRAGGYNLRNTTVGVPPGPYDDESQDSYEIGLKSTLFDGRARFNLAVFRNEIEGMQRDVRTVVGPNIAQVTRNTADVTIEGVEAEFQWMPTDELRISGFVGYLDSTYERILYDLSGDGIVSAVDYALELPRLVDMSYGVTAEYTRPINADFDFRSRLSFAHRNDAPGTDDNVGRLSPADMLDASVGVAFGNRWEVSLYGRNLLNEVTEGGDGAVPFNDPTRNTGDIATLAPLNEGRVYGLELNMRF